MKYDGFQLKHVESLYNSLYINTVKKLLETLGPSHMAAQIASFYRVDLLRRTPLEILQMSWCNTLQLLTMVKAQHNCLVSENCWPLPDLKAGKCRSDWPCQKRHNTSHPKQNFWPFRLKFWYVVLHMESYKKIFFGSPMGAILDSSLDLNLVSRGPKSLKMVPEAYLG